MPTPTSRPSSGRPLALHVSQGSAGATLTAGMVLLLVPLWTLPVTGDVDARWQVVGLGSAVVLFSAARLRAPESTVRTAWLLVAAGLLLVALSVLTDPAPTGAPRAVRALELICGVSLIVAASAPLLERSRREVRRRPARRSVRAAAGRS